MKINKVKESLPIQYHPVFIMNKDMTDIKESRVIDFNNYIVWSHGGPLAGGGPLGLTFEDYPYWISKEDLLEDIKNNV